MLVRHRNRPEAVSLKHLSGLKKSIAKRLNWNFPDPSVLEGTREKKQKETREIRDQIRTVIEAWIRETA